MKNPNIVTIYSTELEIKRVKNTFKKIDWFKEKGYWPRIRLPKLLADKTSLNSTDESLIKNAVYEEYDEQKYISFSIETKKRWDAVCRKFDLSTIFSPLKLQKEYDIQLTQYGVGGSYYLPNHIVVNIHMKRSGSIESTLLHEIIHLSIQKLIDKYSVAHWHKERLVELIILKNLPEVAYEQNLPKEAYKVDKLFEQPYSDIESLIMRL